MTDEPQDQTKSAPQQPLLKRDVAHAVELTAAAVTLAKEGPPLVKAGVQKLQAVLKHDSDKTPGSDQDS